LAEITTPTQPGGLDGTEPNFRGIGISVSTDGVIRRATQFPNHNISH